MVRGIEPTPLSSILWTALVMGLIGMWIPPGLMARRSWVRQMSTRTKHYHWGQVVCIMMPASAAGAAILGALGAAGVCAATRVENRQLQLTLLYGAIGIGLVIMVALLTIIFSYYPP